MSTRSSWQPGAEVLPVQVAWNAICWPGLSICRLCPFVGAQSWLDQIREVPSRVETRNDCMPSPTSRWQASGEPFVTTPVNFGCSPTVYVALSEETTMASQSSEHGCPACASVGDGGGSESDAAGFCEDAGAVVEAFAAAGAEGRPGGLDPPLRVSTKTKAIMTARMSAPTPNASERRRKYTSGGRDLGPDAPVTSATLLGDNMISNEAHPDGPDFSESGRSLIRWFDGHARALPWREPGTTPWGVLVSEIMLQQTQVARVRPVWEAWVGRWPVPAALAAEPLAEALRAWGRLGYPRRAARLHEASRVIVAEHGGHVPDGLEALLALPGVGTYTARAVLAFAFGRRAPVVDVNVRRVLRRILHGEADGPARAQDLPDALALLPEDPASASKLSAALMELGQTVCLPEAPNCAACPIHPCRWAREGKPVAQAPAGRRAPRYAGSDRQARGAILAALRESAGPLRKAELDQVWLANPEQRERALASLVVDGLVRVDSGRIALGG